MARASPRMFVGSPRPLTGCAVASRYGSGCARPARRRHSWGNGKEETMRFKDKVALITAVASGIGRATADIMAREGAIVVGIDNNQERLDAAVDAMNKAGGCAHARLCNALEQAQVDDVVAGVRKEFGRIDILVNAVGGSTIIARPNALVEEHSLDDWQKIIDFNLNGTFLFTHAVVPIMK